MLTCVAVLVPWTVFLGLSLPDQHRANHWRLTWTGFDGLLLLALGATVYLGWRGRQAVIPGAIVTATLLVCDAWFDVTLDLGTAGVWWSVASAVLIELPLAVFFLSRALRMISLTARQAYARLGIDEPPPSVFKLPLFGIAREPDQR
ncbi:hypothetical protein KGA66_11820 [Actinocrinis puniceicyclus]|uniref:Uncharacterized protein n=1 Tax=Actinocrinis puniceicyclus TaxID=977794 RepID=A0A8J7WN18_9ACTN|nr:hypothetical protein [Actinocrinis puniceicyclus]MBS2963740.1 hypothetical protein [Actinocrinis puniceicyclus]